ncbi:hypothetical protein [Spirosoma endophyticum]|uniref:Uncharacterized protein n=1 Tax=Spirosoma endophyticum TaxID=662367 RepID=A0A1I2ID12_9BACT|nr:hypothetical protein [Spirosoma endophyticum]SFF40175.1 hypothetical protein SAMN05216167_1691 [Spirosoma endophyticum]
MRLIPFYCFLMGLGLFLTACHREPALNPNDPEELLLTKQVTARYRLASQPNVTFGLPLTYKGVTFYPITRQQYVYQYDDKKRLVSVSARNPDRLEYTYEWGDESYAYADNQLIYTNLRVFPLIPTSYPLTPLGYIVSNNTYDQYGYLTYRQDGPKASTTQTIVAGNIVKEVYQDAISRLTTEYEYDLSRSGLPNPVKIMWGRPSRNLVTKTVQTNESFTGVAPILPDHSVTTYAYEFDEQGRVKQQTAYIESSLLANPNVVDRELQISVFEFK